MKQPKNNFRKGSNIAKKYDEIMKNPLYNGEVSYEPSGYTKPERSCLAGNMPKGDFSGLCFLNSELYKRIDQATEGFIDDNS